MRAPPSGPVDADGLSASRICLLYARTDIATAPISAIDVAIHARVASGMKYARVYPRSCANRPTYHDVGSQPVTVGLTSSRCGILQTAGDRMTTHSTATTKKNCTADPAAAATLGTATSETALRMMTMTKKT